MPCRALPIIFVVWINLTLGAYGDEPPVQPDIEKLPPPRQGAPAVPFYILPPPMPRLDTRAGWSYFGTDQTGRFRPRVVLSPYGSYYLYSGEPYPWSPRPRLVMPMTSD
jgi:hypothetical protein